MVGATIRVGISGGARGASFLHGLLQASEGRLVAVYDPAPEAREWFRREHGVGDLYANYEQMLDAVDAVIVSSPQQYHVPQAVAALSRGKHVLSEVPAAVSLEQAYELLAAVRSSDTVYMMAENCCYTRANLIVREMARAGLFGDLYFGEGEYLHELHRLHHDAQGRPTWRYYWQVGRNAVTYPTHSLGPVLDWLQDRLVAVRCAGTGRHTDPEHAMEDTVLLLGKTSRGALVKLRLDMLSHRPDLTNYYSLQGTMGAYEAARVRGEGARVYLQGTSPHLTWQPLEDYAARFLPARYKQWAGSAGHGGADAWPVRDFLAAIAGGTPPPIDVYAALDMTLPGIVSEASLAQGGAWVAVPDPRFLTAGLGTAPGREWPLA
jgi:predicted dehydrogenase